MILIVQPAWRVSKSRIRWVNSAANSLGRLADITAFIGVNSREWVNKGLNPRSGKGQ